MDYLVEQLIKRGMDEKQIKEAKSLEELARSAGILIRSDK